MRIASVFRAVPLCGLLFLMAAEDDCTIRILFGEDGQQPEPAPFCSSDADCGPGQYCELQTSCLPPADGEGSADVACVPEGICIDGDIACPLIACGDDCSVGVGPDGCATCDCSGGGGGGGGECSSDADCGGGLVCEVQESCLPIAPGGGGEGGELCESFGVCVDPCAVCPQDAGCTIVEGHGVICGGGDPDGTCLSDAECDPDEYCLLPDIHPMPARDEAPPDVIVVSGICVAKPDVGVCAAIECAPGHICVERVQCFDVDPTAPGEPPCMVWAECVPTPPPPPPPECYDDADCGPEGFCRLFCEADPTSCLDPNAYGGFCEYPLPPPVNCASDEDCAEGELCVPPPEDCGTLPGPDGIVAPCPLDGFCVAA